LIPPFPKKLGYLPPGLLLLNFLFKTPGKTIYITENLWYDIYKEIPFFSVITEQSPDILTATSGGYFNANRR